MESSQPVISDSFGLFVPSADAKDIMIDLETGGTKPGDAILSIGACTFREKDGGARYCFHAFAKADDRFRIQPSTLTWWEEKHPEAKKEAFSGRNSIDDVLFSFADYISQFKEVRVWGNSASFDLKILERAYEICNIPIPWTRRQEMCYRTLKNLFPQVPYYPPAKAHNAFEDALAQAAHADAIFAVMYPSKENNDEHY